MGLFGDLLNALAKVIWGAPEEQPPPPPPQRPYYPPPYPASPPPSSRPARPQVYRPAQQQVQTPSDGDEQFTALRAQAIAAGDRMARCFKESTAAYTGGDRARAKLLSDEGKGLQRKQVDLNRQASERIFAANNKDRQPGEVDLHGLYVKEAVSFADTAIQRARRRGDSAVHLIVGRGLHSQGGVAKVKPAIEALIQKYNLVAALDPRNAGVLIVDLDGPGRAWESRL